MKRKRAGKKTSQPAVPSPSGESLVPLEQVRTLIDLLEERGLEELELEKHGVRIRIRRAGVPAPAPVFASTAPPGENPSRPANVPTSSAEVQAETAAEMGVSAEDVHIVKSPIVGTYYAAPRPDAPPFVNLGDAVEVGQVLCIIEAMKLMNEIEADVAGEIVRLYAENAQPVEYGEPLFAIRPLRKK